MAKVGTYSTRRIEPTDFEELRKNAAAPVYEELAELARPDDRVARAAEIIRQADAVIGTYVGDRERAIASLWFYEHTQGLARLAGIAPMWFRSVLYTALYGIDSRKWTPALEEQGIPEKVPAGLSAEELVELAKKHHVPHVENAAEQLPKLARFVAEAKARREAAMPFLQDAALALREEPYGWGAAQIADKAGIAEKLVYQHWAAAKKRQK